MMKEIKAALQVATVQAAWERNGSDVPDVVGAQFGALVTAEVTRWRKVVAEVSARTYCGYAFCWPAASAGSRTDEMTEQRRLLLRCMSPDLAHLGPGAMSDLSPQSGPKQPSRSERDRSASAGSAITLGSGGAKSRSLTGHFNRGLDGIFKIVRVLGRGLVSVAEVHAIAAKAHLA
jgi:hypothetical protein